MLRDMVSVEGMVIEMPTLLIEEEGANTVPWG